MAGQNNPLIFGDGGHQMHHRLLMVENGNDIIRPKIQNDGTTEKKKEDVKFFYMLFVIVLHN